MRPRGSGQRIADLRDDPYELDVLADRLEPRNNRALILERFDQLFLSGTAPNPVPDGFLAGRLLGPPTWGWLASGGQGLASLWMPWQGKSFSVEASTGLNRFSASARIPLKAVFPSYAPELVAPGRIDAFPFR